MKRYEAMRNLASISEMTDHELSINTEYIRKTASAAYSLLGSMSRVLEENRRFRTTIEQQRLRIKRLEEKAKAQKEGSA